MSSHYKKSEILVLSSRYEGFGLVLIEAMSQGCAPVACDYKGRQREILEETQPNPPYLGREPDCAESNINKSSLNREDIGGSSVCGLCCEPDNVEELADAIQKMMIDKKYRKTVQENSVERSKFYNLDHIISMREGLLKKIS